jgi:hypothetical protein
MNAVVCVCELVPANWPPTCRAQKEAEAAAKAERLREMTERLAAWQAAQFQGAGLAPPGQQQQQ